MNASPKCKRYYEAKLKLSQIYVVLMPYHIHFLKIIFNFSRLSETHIQGFI